MNVVGLFASIAVGFEGESGFDGSSQFTSKLRMAVLKWDEEKVYVKVTLLSKWLVLLRRLTINIHVVSGLVVFWVSEKVQGVGDHPPAVVYSFPLRVV